MSISRLQYASAVCKKPLLLGVIALSISWLSISWLSLSALAQVQQSQSELPSAPSATQPAATVSFATSDTIDHSLTFGRRAHLYARSVFSPETIIGPAFGAGIGQWEDAPPAWGQGAEGYGKRFGSGMARRTISETVRFGFAAVDGEDPRYFRSENRGIWSRTRHAIASTFVSQTSGGATIPAFSRFVGTYGAAFISNTWYPDSRATAGDAARRGTTGLVATIGFHLVREFMPHFGGSR
jgi:hypothetical protein